MASLARQPNGTWVVQFFDVDGARRTLRLPKCDKRTAEATKVRIEHLAAAKLAGHPPSDDTLRWLNGVGDVLRERLARAGLVAAAPGGMTLGEFLDDYFRRRPDVKQTTVATWERTRRVLLAFFKPERPLRSITAADARDFERWLHTPAARVLEHEGGTPHLAESTIRRRIGHCRQLWNEALVRGLVPENPFRGLAAHITGNAAKRRYISLDDLERLLEAAPSPAWRALIGLARLAGCRVPSESHALLWADVDWQRHRIRIRALKTARHPGHEAREVPMVPRLEGLLRDAWEAAPEGSTHVINGIGYTNPGTHLKRLIRKAGLAVWPKPWHNLRASLATDWAQDFPSHVAAAWLGHSPLIANEHYRMVREEHYQQALQSALQQLREQSGNDRNAVAPPSQETPCFPVFSASCGVVQTHYLGDEGLEPPTSCV